MPTFEYVCQDCKTPYDIFFKVREEKDEIVCPSCSSVNSTKKLSAFATTASSPDFGDFGGCETGSCGVPSYSPCASGNCSLN